MSIIDTLITDRTQADVTKLKSLLSKPKAMWTNEEWSEFLLAKDKGAYNAADLNRVQEAMEYLAERFRGYGYNVPEIKRPSITEVIPGTSKLPEGYTELEYIESSGTQYIDTGFAPNQDSRVDAVFETAQTGDCGIAVADQEWQSNGFGIWGNAACYGSTTSQDVVFYDKGKILVSLNKNNLYEDGELIWTATSATFQVPVNMTLFALNRNGSVSEKTTMTLYSCQVYDNGTLVRDYVPCLNPSNEVGLYDIVNGVFYGNAGTGYFLPGPVASLPEGYTRLDYIQSSGTQYINTEFIPNQDTRVVLAVESESATFSYTHGAFDVDSTNLFAVNSSRVFYGSGSTAISGVPSGKIEIDQNKNSYIVGGVTGSLTAAVFSSNFPMYLFALNNGGTVSSGKYNGKLYSCQIFDNDVLVRLYTPVLTDSGEVGLYDSITGAFFGNKGTGYFVPGPVCDLPEGYTRLEYIQSSGAQYIDTEFMPNQDTRIDITVSDWASTETSTTLFGTQTGTSDRYDLFITAGGLYRSYYAGAYVSFGSGLSCADKTSISKNGATVTIGANTLTHTTGSFACTTSLYLMGHNTSGSVSKWASLKLYFCLIYDNGVLTRLYTPAKNANGEIGLYDSIGGKFYGNAGTGAFTAGDELGASDGGGNIPSQTIERDYWEIGDIPRREQMDQYLANLRSIWALNEVMRSTPEIPSDMEGLLHTEANDIEQILIDVDYLLSVMVLNWFYTAEVFCGEV